MTQTSWKIRRRVMFVVLGFCFATIAYVLGAGLETTPADTAVTMSYGVIGMIVSVYVLSASYEDVQMRKMNPNG